MTQRELAARAGVHNTYISKLEKGEERPSQGLVDALAKALNAERIGLQLAAGYMPREFQEVISANKDIWKLLLLASQGRLSSQFEEKLKALLEREGRINVPVWLE